MLHLNEYSVFDNVPEQVAYNDNTLNEIAAGMQFIDHIKNDEQLDKGHENYCEFVNVSIDFFRDVAMQNNFKMFIRHITIMTAILNEIGLDVEPHPDEDETVIHCK